MSLPSEDTGEACDTSPPAFPGLLLGLNPVLKLKSSIFSARLATLTLEGSLQMIQQLIPNGSLFTVFSMASLAPPSYSSRC